MNQLLLLRHAKSSHEDKTLIDYDRPLAKRGRKDCKKIGRWLAGENLIPDLVISSPAKRARQTALKVCKEIGYSPKKIQWDENVYDANVRDLLKILSTVEEDDTTVMLVGHHQGLESMILRLSNWADIPADPKLIPTCAIARLKIKDDWADIKKCEASLKSITRPRDLVGKKLRSCA